MAENQILLGGAGERQILLDAGMANRHGLITGATGTGKTVTLQLLAESFSRFGVPVFTADIKGDLSGVARPGTEHPKISERVARIGISDHVFEGCPVLAMADVCGFGHDEDIICRALAHGRTEAEAIRNYWASADAQ